MAGTWAVFIEDLGHPRLHRVGPRHLAAHLQREMVRSAALTRVHLQHVALEITRTDELDRRYESRLSVQVVLWRGPAASQ
jgi:hypothetical protein